MLPPFAPLVLLLAAATSSTSIAKPPIVRTDLPAGKVLVQLCETGFSDKNEWPAKAPPETERYQEEAFGFFEVPHKYVDTGVRADRGYPFLVRASAVVTLPAGQHRLLLRGRGACRLYVDGVLVMSTPFAGGDGTGHGSIPGPDKYLNLGPDFRFAPPGNRETWKPFTSKGGEHVVVLESIVGNFLGKAKRRPEMGETVVAVSLAGSESWQLLSPGSRVVPYTDAGWMAYEAAQAERLLTLNAAARAAKRAEHADYLTKRDRAARTWLAMSKAYPVPELPKGYPANNDIDHFLAATLDRAVQQKAAAAKSTVNYFKQIQPILEAKCYGCHTGANAKGKLRLDDRAAALTGGKKDGPAIVAHQPDKSALLARIHSNDEDVMPPKGEPVTAEEKRLLKAWIADGAHWPDLNAEHTTVTPLASDLVFLRRVFLDTVGVIPTLEEIRAFEADKSPNRRAKWIDKLLADRRTADHGMGYWQDVLAENPNILNPTLNNTGPFRWWLYESLLDNKPMDLFVTELLRMRGSERFGGPAGFAIASQNDSPFAAKGTIVASAFLGVEMKCARCHDAPAHVSTQRELFQLAAMLATKPLKVPATSSVPISKIQDGGRKPLISVTLPANSTVEAVWPFPQFANPELGKKLAEYPNESRDQLAALITAPQNERFAQVMANRVWKRLMGRGIVEPVDDWERGQPSHPELLKWLGREFVRMGYDVKELTRLILNSHAYQRETNSALLETDRLYAAPASRRLEAEQIVDSLFVGTGKPFRVEEVSLDIDGMREQGSSITLGKPRRSWMLTSTSNERDRPSLALPRIQAVTDVLQAYGWRGARQDPTSARDNSSNVIQPAILSNGVMGTWLVRLSDDHGVTQLALTAKSPKELLDQLFLRVLTRHPTANELTQYSQYLNDGFANRVNPAKPAAHGPRQPEPYVSWSNHLDPEATIVRQRQEAAARAGDPATDRLNPDWRARLEDVLWALLNSPEFVFTP